MMINRLYYFLLSLGLCLPAQGAKPRIDHVFYTSTKNPILVQSDRNQKYSYIIEDLKKFNISYLETNDINNKDGDHLYIIFNGDSLSLSDFPPCYILVQTKDMEQTMLSKDDLEKIKGAIAVWDTSWSNIKKYKELTSNYYYYPSDYDYADPVILSCFLPINVLRYYKELLCYSNQFNSDISSHLPALFVHSIVQNPSMIVEAGVRGGEGSTTVFKYIAELCDAKIIGLDIDNTCNNSYKAIKNASFICMDDVKFPNYYKKTNELNRYPLDIVFIDTSHLYNHTLAEISSFVPVLSKKGQLIFHDSNMSPLNNLHSWYCLNGDVYGVGGWDNKKGVIRAIKDYFSISYDETQYTSITFKKDGQWWHLVHYPFCNGLTILKKVSVSEV